MCRIILRLTLSFLVCILSACSSPRSRIEENPKLFSSYPAETQLRLQNGLVQTGDTPEMVYVALGSPGEKSSSKWKYFDRSATEHPPSLSAQSTGLSSPFGYPSPGPHPSTPLQSGVSARLKTIVEFKDGKVSSVREF